MSAVYNVTCMLCGRFSGQVRSGRFYAATAAPMPVRENGRSRCGFCSGNLYLEADDSSSVPYAIADSLAARRAS
jgi:hypothetical protein